LKKSKSKIFYCLLAQIQPPAPILKNKQSSFALKIKIVLMKKFQFSLSERFIQ